MDNPFNIERLGVDSVLFHKLPSHPLTHEEVINIVAWLIVEGMITKKEVWDAVLEIKDGLTER